MPTPRSFRLAALTLVVGGALAACRRPVPPGAAPAPDTASTAGTSGAATTPPPAPAGGSSLDDEAARAAAELRNALLAPVYFEFDQSDLSDQTRASLEQKATLMRQRPELAVRILGHTDNRGSDEYNLALGQRRAAVVKRYLMERGIAESRMELVSYGEERPASEGEDESARSQNRRAEFEITAGGDAGPSGSQSQTSP